MMMMGFEHSPFPDILKNSHKKGVGFEKSFGYNGENKFEETV